MHGVEAEKGEKGDRRIILAIRAGLVYRPGNYRWSSLGYHQQTGNEGDFLSLDFGLIGAE